MTTIVITYILSIGDVPFDVPFIDADSIGSLDTAKEVAKTIMRNNKAIDSIEINREDSRFSGLVYEGKMERDDDVDWQNVAIHEWCDRIKTQGAIERPWICRIQEEIYSDDGEWCDMYDGEPWNGFYIRREF